MELPDRVRDALGRAAVRTQLRSTGPRRTSQADLIDWARAHLSDRKLVVVSNRQPYSHMHSEEGIRVSRNAGGLTVALDAIARALGGVWVAHGSGDADREVTDEHDRVAAPPSRPAYQLRRIWLGELDHARYYSGLSNSALWPLCHIVYVRPRFRAEEWEQYVEVNRRFADAVLEEVGDQPAIVFLQDYHLSLVAKFLRESGRDLRIAQFWHIPWPNPEVFRILPWRHEVLEGLLANDLVGFHTRTHAINFLDSVNAEMEARVDHAQSSVERSGHRTFVGNFPIGVDAEEIGALAGMPVSAAGERRIRHELGLEGIRVGLGVDRMDYTKGIPERLEALEAMFERHPDWVGRFAFVQIGVPTRIELAEYRAVRDQSREIAHRINLRFPRAGGPTVHLIERNLDFFELVPYYRLADLCAVTSLHDGMNLVAKEYVAACIDGEGALVLSPFTGAARELARAYLASPFDREAMAEAYHQALVEDPAVRRERMAALRETVLRFTVFDWAIDVLDALVTAGLRAPAAQSRGALGR
jgi:trehalose 6-phosphate synthase